MKQTKVLTTVSLILILTLVPFTGCSTAPTYVTYSFAADGSPSAKIDFTTNWEGGGSDYSGVSFINYNGAKRPKPEKKHAWNSEIVFPAEKPLPLTVRAQYVAPMPMLTIAAGMGSFTGGVANLGGGSGWALFFLSPIILVAFALTLTFFSLALVVDLPMALIMNFDKKVAFDCPPLEADKTYALVLQRKKPRRLVLLDVNGDSGTEVYEQKF
jgi:hypothetical protein